MKTTNPAYSESARGPQFNGKLALLLVLLAVSVTNASVAAEATSKQQTQLIKVHLISSERRATPGAPSNIDHRVQNPPSAGVAPRNFAQAWFIRCLMLSCYPGVLPLALWLVYVVLGAAWTWTTRGLIFAMRGGACLIQSISHLLGFLVRGMSRKDA